MNTKCVAYLRTSTKTNIGENKDSDKRQLRTIKNFCKSQKFKHSMTRTLVEQNHSMKDQNY